MVRRGHILTGSIFFVLGLVLFAGGVRLLLLQGSAYYAIAGIGLAACGALIGAGKRTALGLFIVLFAATLVWSVVEARLDGWQLLPRLDLWLVLGSWLLLPTVNRTLHGARPPTGLGNLALWSLLVVSAALCVYGIVRDPHDVAGTFDSQSMQAPLPDTAAKPGRDWDAYGGSARGDRYSAAAQITPANVAQLQRAWTFHTGDVKGPGDPGEIANEVTPLKANELLYICTPHNIVIALDPDTGTERWRFDPHINRDAKDYQHMICRGVAYYDADRYGAAAAPADAAAQHCRRRIYAPTADATIVALDADNGQPCEQFGTHGVIGLTDGMSMKRRGFLNPTSPPLVTQHVLIASASVTDNDSTFEPSGVIRGYDIDSGKLLWKWDAAVPDDNAPLAPGATYVANSPNSWSVASADEPLGLVYIPMGNQTPDIWGGNRIPAAEHFNSAIVALDIASGRVRWSYQTVHHDLWDMDIGSQPTLVDLDLPQGRKPALIAPTKTGSIFVLDRRDGSLLVPAPELPVPQGAAEGDRTAPTQPFSALTFAPDNDLREADMWGTNPFDQLLCRIEFKRHRYDGKFTPPSEQGSLVYPGNYGIFDWGGVAVDPVRQILIASPTYMAFRSKLVRHENAADNATPTDTTVPATPKKPGGEQGLQMMRGTPFAVDLQPLLSPLGIPCQAPPWGYMAAVDLRTLKKVWIHRNGTVRDSAPLPIPLPLGVPSLGGPLTTAGGVAFLSSTLDYYLRAYDVQSGRVLWRDRLPAGGQATPMSYVSDKTGRQYVVVMAGGHGSLGTKMGDSLVAYALPANGAPSTAADARP